MKYVFLLILSFLVFITFINTKGCRTLNHLKLFNFKLIYIYTRNKYFLKCFYMTEIGLIVINFISYFIKFYYIFEPS